MIDRITRQAVKNLSHMNTDKFLFWSSELENGILQSIDRK